MSGLWSYILWAQAYEPWPRLVPPKGQLNRISRKIYTTMITTTTTIATTTTITTSPTMHLEKNGSEDGTRRVRQRATPVYLTNQSSTGRKNWRTSRCRCWCWLLIESWRDYTRLKKPAIPISALGHSNFQAYNGSILLINARLRMTHRD